LLLPLLVVPLLLLLLLSSLVRLLFSSLPRLLPNLPSFLFLCLLPGFLACSSTPALSARESGAAA
jgi:hypothetical protein